VNKVLILGKASRSTDLISAVLKNEKFDVAFIEERRVDSLNMLKKRITKLGVLKVFNQLLFIAFARFQKRNKKTINRLKFVEAKFIKGAQKATPSLTVQNINSFESQQQINAISPNFIVLSGTRILSAELLSKLSCPIINIHAGITPAYRGVHGGYWSLVNNDVNNFGSTIHFVDEGIDTGAIISHLRVTPSNDDNFSTYPLLQLSAALEKLPEIINNIVYYKKNTFCSDLPSELWSHPTIWQYIYYRMQLKVK